MAIRSWAARWALGAVFCAALCACGPSAPAQSAGAAEVKAQEFASLSVSQAIVRPGSARGTTGAYLLLVSHNASDDHLIGASSPIAARVEIHEHVKKAGGVMAMQRVKAPLVLPAQGQLAFEPGSLHLMAFDLNRPLLAGETVPFTLMFEKAGPVEIAFVVGKPARPKHAPSHAHGGH